MLGRALGGNDALVCTAGKRFGPPPSAADTRGPESVLLKMGELMRPSARRSILSERLMRVDDRFANLHRDKAQPSRLPPEISRSHSARHLLFSWIFR